MNIQFKSFEQCDKNNYYLIATGGKGVMYSLYLCRCGEYYDEYSQRHIANLSEDIQTAKDKVVERLKDEAEARGGLTVYVNENKMSDRAEQYYYLRMKSGKHEGKSILHDLMTEDIKYVIWLLGLATKKAKHIKQEMEEMADRGIRLYQFNYDLTLTKRETWLINNANDIWQEYFRQFPKPKSTSEHIGSVGERMTVRMKLTKRTGFDTQWGYTSIFMFKDEDGNVFKYMGNGRWYQTGFDEEFVDVTFTVKSHDEYRDVKQTRMNRPKMAKVPA